MIFGKLICKLPKWLGGGHRRGRKGERYMTDNGRYQDARCPRCGRALRYKVKA